jgi:hypothetical protein
MDEQRTGGLSRERFEAARLDSRKYHLDILVS